MSELTTIFLAKISLATVGIGFAALFYFFRKNKSFKKVLIGIFIPFVILASWGFLNFDKNIIRTGYWDIYHYYLNAKYFDELGYFDLYRASLVANAENGGPFENVAKVRDLSTQIQTIPDSSSAEAESMRAKFSPARWEEFRADVKFFFEKLTPVVLTDRGYNASPTWNKTGSLIANALPLTNPATIPIIYSLDILILVAIFGIITASFGIVPALFFVLLLGVNPLEMRPLQFAFLRLDWLLALVGSIALWRKQKFGLSGALLALSALLRIFPVVLLTGAIVQAGLEFWRKRKISPAFQKFFLGFAIAALVLLLYGSLNQANHLDFSRWVDFGKKIIIHSQTASNQRSGINYLIPDAIDFLRLPVKLLMLGLFAWAIRRAPSEKLIPLSLLLVPVVTAPASYYFCSVSVLVLAFADLAKKENALALSCILLAFILETFGVIYENVYHNSDTSYYWSGLFFILSVALLFVVANEKNTLDPMGADKKIKSLFSKNPKAVNKVKSTKL